MLSCCFFRHLSIHPFMSFIIFLSFPPFSYLSFTPGSTRFQMTGVPHHLDEGSHLTLAAPADSTTQQAFLPTHPLLFSHSRLQSWKVWGQSTGLRRRCENSRSRGSSLWRVSCQSCVPADWSHTSGLWWCSPWGAAHSASSPHRDAALQLAFEHSHVLTTWATCLSALL